MSNLPIITPATKLKTVSAPTNKALDRVPKVASPTPLPRVSKYSWATPPMRTVSSPRVATSPLHPQYQTPLSVPSSTSVLTHPSLKASSSTNSKPPYIYPSNVGISYNTALRWTIEYFLTNTPYNGLFFLFCFNLYKLRKLLPSN